MINSAWSLISLSVVPQRGTSVWSLSVVPQRGPSVWCLSVVPQRGPSAWCLSVVPQRGPSMWYIEALGEHNGGCCVPAHNLDRMETVATCWQQLAEAAKQRQAPNGIPSMRSRCHSSTTISCCLNLPYPPPPPVYPVNVTVKCIMY